MLVTTTPIIEGEKIREYRGPVFAQVVTGFSWVKGFSAAFRSIVGGRSETHEDLVHRAREMALQEIVNHARHLGANAIVGFHVDFDVIGGDANSLLLAKASGTAVVI